MADTSSTPESLQDRNPPGGTSARGNLPDIPRSGPKDLLRTILLSAILIGLVAVTFLPVLHNDFIGFDDPEYVTGNVHVQHGLTWQGVAWAFRTTDAANWHPLTWLSHMLDCQLYGLAPRGHHLTSILLHAANTLLLFLILRRMTGATGRSFFVSALFAVHPLRVESVAWVSERKDVLSTAFFLLTILAYVRYAERRLRIERPASSALPSPETALSTITPQPRVDTWGSALDYLLALLLFALALMSKPMVVTMPFVLLLLDYWPLGRLKYQTLGRRVIEKVPFLLMAAASSVITFAAQKRGGSVSAAVSFLDRLGNALVSYWRYLGKLAWPADLAVYYPYPGRWPLLIVAAAAIGLAAVTLFAFACRRKRPYFLVGWLWYLGILVPVIGLVRVGEQAMADRYSYIPSIGMLVILAWGIPELMGRWRGRSLGAAAAAIAAIVCCIAVTRAQIRFWQNSEILFRHAIAVTKGNYLAYDNLGTALSADGQVDASISAYREALRIHPDFAEAHSNLGASLAKKNRVPEALSQFLEAIRLKPDFALAHYNLANTLADAGQLAAAVAEYQNALRIRPDDENAHYNLGNTLNRMGRPAEAIREYREVLRLDPQCPEAFYNIGAVLCRDGHLEQAVVQLRLALKYRPNYAEAHVALGAILEGLGRWDEALAQDAIVARLIPQSPEAHFNLGNALAHRGSLNEAIHEYQTALKLSPGFREAQTNLEAAIALKRAGASSTPGSKP